MGRIDGEVMLEAGLGGYANLNVVDAFALVTWQGIQYNVRASRPLMKTEDPKRHILIDDIVRVNREILLVIGVDGCKEVFNHFSKPGCFHYMLLSGAEKYVRETGS